MVSVEEARKKKCPFSLQAGAWLDCQADSCMAWVVHSDGSGLCCRLSDTKRRNKQKANQSNSQPPTFRIQYLREHLNQKVENLFSTRIRNALMASKILYISDLVRLSKKEVLRIPKMGDRGCMVIEKVLHDFDLHLGMDISKFKGFPVPA